MKSDGCTFWFNGNWKSCCGEHDYIYSIGGTKQQRKIADKQLKKCVAEHGHPIMGHIMYIGVRILGHPFLPFAWRWGFLTRKRKYE